MFNECLIVIVVLGIELALILVKRFYFVLYGNLIVSQMSGRFFLYKLSSSDNEHLLYFCFWRCIWSGEEFFIGYRSFVDGETIWDCRHVWRRRVRNDKNCFTRVKTGFGQVGLAFFFRLGARTVFAFEIRD